VCNKCQQKLSATENKRHTVFVDEVETQLREKTLRGSQTQEFHYSEDEARYKIVPCSLTCNPTRTLPNQVSYLKGSSMEFLTLELTSKIDFNCSAAHFKRHQRDLELL
jgi:hypothetical protein